MRKYILLVLVALTCLVLFALPAVAQDTSTQADAAALRAETTLGLYVTAVQAHAMLQKNKAAVLIDARPRPAYFYLGHFEGSYGLPSRLWTGKFDKEKNTFIFNKNAVFEAEVQKRYPDLKTAILIFSSTGAIGKTAVDRLAAVGYTNVYNVIDGFDGWQKANLPLSRKIDTKKMWLPE